MDRRQFIETTAAAATTSLTLASGVHQFNRRQARRVGLIGAGWYGKVDLLHLLQVEPVEVVSVCDVDGLKLEQAIELFTSRHKSNTKPRGFSDYRKQLADVEHDLVIVGTPDHWHALPAIAAMNAGANVYCEKPTAVDVMESKAMLDTSRKLGRKLQVGTQRRRIPHLLKAKKEIVDAGLLGDIALAEMCCYYHMRRNQTLDQCPDIKPPKNLDWEMWTGPAPMRPYNAIVHPKGWRAFNEYGNGIMGDMCVHVFDMTRWMLGLTWPDSISSSGGIYVQTEARSNIPDTQSAAFTYKDIQLNWTHRTWGNAPDQDYPWASIIYGSKGTLKLDFTKYEFIPRGRGQRMKHSVSPDLKNYPGDEADNKDWEVDLIGALGSRNLMRDWLNAIDQNTKPVADIEEAHLSSACCLLANIAMKLGRTLRFDPATHTVKNDPEANRLLKRPYRSPWTHPADS